MVNAKLSPFLKKMVIDEKRQFSLINFAQYKKNKRVIETDHNGMLLDIKISFSSKRLERKEMFNLKNKICQEAFWKETETNEDLLKCFQNELPLNVQSKKWLKAFNSILYKCFRKVRICESKKKLQNGENNLINERIRLKSKIKVEPLDEDMKHKIEERIEKIEEGIGSKVVNDYHKEIIETIEGLGGDDTALDGSGRRKL